MTPRLQLIADSVRKNSRVADIGTDHAFIPVYLIKNNISPFCYACDIGTGPLKNAQSSVERENLQDKISLILSDGLDALEENSADDIIIAGMGGEMIADIVTRAHWLRNKNILLILQPMTMHHVLRRVLSELGFEPIGDKYCVEGKRFYTVMLYRFTGNIYTPDTAFLYCGTAFKSKSPLAAEYIARQKSKLNEQLNGMENSKYDTSASRKYIKEVLNSIERSSFI